MFPRDVQPAAALVADDLRALFEQLITRMDEIEIRPETLRVELHRLGVVSPEEFGHQRAAIQRIWDETTEAATRQSAA